MFLTPHHLLAEAAHRFRMGDYSPVFLDANLTKAQIGAATRLAELGQIKISKCVSEQIEQSQEDIKKSFSPGTNAYTQAFSCLDSISSLETTLDRWFSDNTDSESLVKIGYWLMCVFLRGLNQNETLVMTYFLSDKTNLADIKLNRKSLRRYPTGGISEKQALLLPAFLRYFCHQYEWCSSFLVARRLAHTGGTHDKLGVLPGIKLATAAELHCWNGVIPPVLYFSAGIDFCPRDALLYRLRGETGTVPDLGLMVSSVMSKQIAMPADVIVLDILFGDTAFLSNKNEADRFADWCAIVAKEFSVSVTPYFRQSNNMLGLCVGNVVEVWEAISLFENAKNSLTNTFADELKLSINFIEIFAQQTGVNKDEAIRLCDEGLRSGEILDSLFQLWEEHGVNLSFLDAVRKNSKDALLGSLLRKEIYSQKSGVLRRWDFLAIADFANNHLNTYSETINSKTISAATGGIELMVKIGVPISKGDLLAVIYSQTSISIEISEKINGLFDIY